MIPLVKVGLPPRDELMPRLGDVLYSGMIGEGELVPQFEERFATTFGLPNAVSLSSGSAALHAALNLAGVGRDDDVISTAMTAEPTNTVIAQMGARPVWADIDPENGNMDSASIRDAITQRTRAIVVVHYAGYPVDMAAVTAVAREAGLPVIEDCAHALGASYRGHPIGSLGDFAIFSFQAIKHLTTVDGGMLTMRDPSQLGEAQRFRRFGLQRGVDRRAVNITSQGYKYNMTNVAAAIGLAQLDVIGERLQKHILNGDAYNQAFASMNHVRPASIVPGACPSYWLYTLLTDDPADIVRRLDGVAAASTLHRRNDAHAIFASSARVLPQLDRFYSHMIHIPCGWWVEAADRARIIAAIAG